MDVLNQAHKIPERKPSLGVLTFGTIAAAIGGGFSMEPASDESKLVARSTPKHRRGACECCGKPNVRAGRDSGVYLCMDCMQAQKKG